MPLLVDPNSERAPTTAPQTYERLVVCGMAHTRSARPPLMVTGVEPPGMGTHTLDDDVRESRISAAGLKEGGRGCSKERGRRLAMGGSPAARSCR